MVWARSFWLLHRSSLMASYPSFCFTHSLTLFLGEGNVEIIRSNSQSTLDSTVDKMQIFAVALSGTTVALSVEPMMSIGQVQQMIQDMEASNRIWLSTFSFLLITLS